MPYPLKRYTALEQSSGVPQISVTVMLTDADWAEVAILSLVGNVPLAVGRVDLLTGVLQIEEGDFRPERSTLARAIQALTQALQPISIRPAATEGPTEPGLMGPVGLS